MWVHRDVRGLGLGRRLLRTIEHHAIELGLHAVRLGTNRALTEALSLYRSTGYAEIPAYGDTAHVDHSFEKPLLTAAPS